MYIVKYLAITDEWLVININTQVAQSAWKDKVIAGRVAKDLNKLY